MNDLNVALRLSLVNQMKAGAEDARRDLQKIKAEADKLGKVNAALSPASLRAAQQTRQIETQKALAVERTTAAYRRQRSEMLAGDLAARRVDRARDVRAAREVARMRRETRSAQTAMAAAGMAGRGIEWMPDARALRSSEAARRARLDAMTTTMAAQRAAEARALRDVHLGRAAAPARAPGAVPPVPATAGGAAAAGAAGAAGGVAASGKAAGLTYARSFVGGLGIGIGAAAVGQFVKESILGAATDEFERDQLRVLGNISEKQMEAFRKGLDRTARLRGIGSQGALGTFGGLMAGGLSAKESAAFVDPVAIFSKATGASLPDATRSTVALRNNMGLTTAEEIMAAYDAIAVGGKAGEFEVADMASHMPSLLAKMQKLGEGGVSGVRNMVAMAQAIRQTVGTSAEAATNFENMLDKFTANDFVQNARKFGINVEKTMKDAEKNGLSPVFAMLQAIERKTGGDPFKIAKLMPDRQASAAVLAVLGRMDLVMQILSESSEAAGSTMKDYETATDNAWESWNRFSSTIIEKSKAVAESALPAITAAMDSVTDAMSDGKVGASGLLAELQRLNSGATLNFDADEYLKGLKGEYEGDTFLSRFFGASRGQKDILTPVLNWLNGRAKHLNKGLFGESERERWDRYMSLRGKPAPAPTRMTQGPRAAEDASMEEYRGLLNSGHLEAILAEEKQKRLDAAEARRKANMNPVYRKIEMPSPQEPGRADDGTPMPSSPSRTIDRMLEGMRNPAGAAAEAMDEYNQALGRGLGEAKATISAAVAEFKAMLSFTAGPTISPSVVPAGATVAAPAVQQAGRSGGGTLNVTQNISTSDPRIAARRAQREQNRAMNLAMANALHDTGLA